MRRKRTVDTMPYRRPEPKTYPAREAAIGAELHAIARVRYPERFAPDGTPLIRYRGATWVERRASWETR